MYVSTVMNPNVIVATPAQPVEECLRQMAHHHILGLPIVDDTTVVLGWFGLRHFLGLLLPRAALLEGGVSDLSFMTDTVDQLRQKLDEIEKEAVGQHMQVEFPILYADTPLSEGILLLYHAGENLPVIDRSTRQLVGIFSAWDLFEKVR